eukprot:392277-Pleurochrysis_carterae.AAC.3
MAGGGGEQAQICAQVIRRFTSRYVERSGRYVPDASVRIVSHHVAFDVEVDVRRRGELSRQRRAAGPHRTARRHTHVHTRIRSHTRTFTHARSHTHAYIQIRTKRTKLTCH